MIESDRIGMRTTGHSTGNLYSLVDQRLYGLAAKWGTDTAKEVVRSRTATINKIEEIVRKNAIDCAFEKVVFTYFSERGSRKGMRTLEKEAKAGADLGLDPQMRTASALPFATKAALEFGNQAQFHPLRYVRGICAALPPSVQVFENSPVLEIDPRKGVLRCPSGQVIAKVIVIATHIPKGFAAVQMRLSPIREHGIAAPLKHANFEGTFWRVDSPKRSIRTLNIDGKDYVIVIGDKFKTGHNSHNEKENDALNEYVSERFPLLDQRWWWAAQSYRSADGLPFIGSQRNNTYFLTGFSTDGLVYGTLGAELIADQILGRKNQWSDLYKPKRCTPMKSAFVVAKEGIDNVCQYARDLPKIGTVPFEQIQPGQGGIVESRGEKIAVFKDNNSKLHAISAVCTHMKCIVRFNPAEKTWDCPCHASRFTVDGKVIEGPAIRDLEAKQL
ncbi:MAG: FAD-dependent oxidoreductase [Bdellovibrionales bacterium]